jgi:GTP-binding protein YchF
MLIGIFGFPKVGKTTLFNTLTGSSVATEAFATGKPETHVGVARVPDARLDRLSAIFKPKKTTHARVEYLDIVGVEKGDAAGGESFLPDLKNADALMHVVRVFGDPNLPHSQGPIDARRDVETMETELILADHTITVRRIERLEANLKKTHRDEDRKELEALRHCLAALEKERPLRELSLPEEDQKRLRGFTFLSAKPLLVVLNLDEKDVGRIPTATDEFGLAEFVRKPAVAVVPASAKIEMEIARLGPDDGPVFMKDLGIDEPCLDRLIRTSYALLGLISFFTVGDDECRAWTIRRGTNAHKAAGTIHSDIERGFIRGEVISYDELIACGSWNAAKEKWRLRLEGKEYIVQDGDNVHFRFNI